MVMTINKLDDECLAMIHDDFGTHAGNTEKMYTAIRTAFLCLYSKNEPLRDWAVQVGVDVETLPETGDYHLSEIMAAEYFFG